MKIFIGSDHAGFKLKVELLVFLKSQSKYEALDLGPSNSERVDYPDYARSVATSVQSDLTSRGILICGSGIGVCMAANRFENIRAVRANSKVEAILSRQHNDANIICFGERLQSFEDCREILETWLSTKFEGGRHLERLAKFKSGI
jgi:ribose 5-phosphate isomerase B